MTDKQNLFKVKPDYLENDLRIAMGQLMKKGQERDEAIHIINAILDAIDHEILIADHHGNIKYLNRKSKTHLFTKIPDSALKKTIENLIRFLNDTYTVGNFDKLLEITQKTSGEKNFISNSVKISVTSSTKKHYEVITSPIYDETWGHLGRIWQFRDITTEEEVDRMKTEFLSIASHQLRTPLTSIKGYIDMMLTGDFGDIPQKLQEPLQAVLAASNQMGELIDDLLDLTRIETGRDAEVKLQEINLVEFLEAELEQLRKLANKKNQRIVLDQKLAPGIICKTDKARIKNSLANLVENAIKYSPENTEITVTMAEFTPKAGQGEQNLQKHIRIDVRDRGIGIPQDQQDRIFEKFFRAANVLTENFDGTGLGLYYVKKAMSDLGGEISFTSEVGKGTIFTIRFPVL